MKEAQNQPNNFTLISQTSPATAVDQLSAIFYCTSQNSRYLAGFKFTYGASAVQQQFGNLANIQSTEVDVSCKTIIVNDWIINVRYYWARDSGLLGFNMVGDGGTEYIVKALGTGAFETSPEDVMLKGPPIGFKVLFSDTLTRKITPFAMATIFNSCACNFSFYLGGQGLRNMSTASVSGTPDSQIVPNQSNFITQIYGQDCGLSILKLSPEYSFLIVTTDTVTGVKILKLESLKNEIGSYGVTAKFSPVDLFSQIKPIEYNFTVFINPCTLQNVVITPPASVSFKVGEPELALPYSFKQVPDCQYPTEVFFTTNLPSYMIHDVDIQKIVFPKTD